MQNASQNCLRCGYKGWRKTGKIDGESNVYKCGRCGQEAISAPPFVRTARAELYVDIETSLTGIIGNFGRKVRGEYISDEFIGHPYYIICWSALLVDKPGKVYSGCVTQDEALKFCDGNILAPLWDLMNKADVCCWHNGDSFDMKKINTRFIMHGYEEVSPYKTIDTLKYARRKYSF